MKIMSKQIKILLKTSAFIIFLIASTGCASLKKIKFNHRKSESYCNLDKLVGPDKYYYSGHYQRKLKRSIKKISLK
jgi:hypothetical protein